MIIDKDKYNQHLQHHESYLWAPSITIVAALWLISSPLTFGYDDQLIFYTNIFSGLALLILNYLSFKPDKVWANWISAFIGFWLLSSPLIFWTTSAVAYLNNTITGLLIIIFSVVIMEMPGIKLVQKKGPETPPGWSYNPSSWLERVPVIFLGWLGFLIARYLASYQLGYIGHAWDPFFGDGTEKILTSKVSKAWPVSDAGLGAISYVLDALMGYLGGVDRWRTMPWVVIIFGILIIPLGVVSITLVVLQPVAVGEWCTLCLTTATVSILMMPFTFDEVLATVQFLIRSKKQGHSFWNTFWKGGTIEGAPNTKTQKYKRSDLPEKVFTGMLSDLRSKPWNLFLSAALGVWLMFSPWLLDFNGKLADSAYLTGSLVITISIITMSEIGRSGRFINMVSGLWLFLSLWIFNAEQADIYYGNIITGTLLIILSYPKGKIADEHGGYNKWII